ncbi:sensor domain-containing diguanylate cyclase [Omnitrophica bacterium]|nr:sensor domain-containing diguanylate cyclase [Candidatus Omnitrophota bacterium]
MDLIRDKIFLGFVACVIFTSLCFFLFQIDLKDSPKKTYFDLTSSYLIFFNVVIISSWLSFGWIGGAIFLALCIVIALSLSVAAASPLYYIHIALFLFTAVLCNKYLKEFVIFRTEYLLNRQKTEEEKNTLAERIEKDRAQAEAAEIKLERYEALKGVAEHLSDIFSHDVITRFLAEKSLEIVGKSARSLVYLVNTDTQELLLTYSKQPQDLPRIKMKKGDVFDKWVLRQNQPLIVLDATKDFRFSQDDFLIEELKLKSLIAVPMVSHNKMIGLLRLDSQKPNIYNPDDLRLLDIIADLGAVSLHNNMLYQRTTELAIRDGLTQLFVHRYFMERLGLEVQRALKKEHSLSILMIDIDHFKNYNDRYGHIAGDILLKHLSSLFISTVNKGDIVARYGGEEFAIMLFGEGRRGSEKIAEDIRKAAEKESFYLRREKTRATVSIGVSVFPDDAKTKEDLLRVADKNLYRAKNEGRNRVCIS